MNIQEDYVSFEVAKLLKEKGFNEACEYCYAYFSDDDIRVFPLNPSHNAQILSKDRYPYITHQLAMKWLREKFNCNIVLDMCSDNNNDCYVLWTFNILQNKNYKIIWGEKQPKFNTYEEAVEAALKYCLENLI